MRVLHVAHGWPPASLGGTERYAAALVRAQADLGATTAAFGPGAPGWRDSGPHRGFAATWSDPQAEAQFAAAVAAFGPDVVHVHHLAGLSLALARLARPARLVLTLHDYWLRCPRGQFATGAAAPCPGPEPGRCARCVAPARWGPLPFAAHLPPGRRALVARDRAVATFLEDVDLVLTPSPHVAARMGLAAEVLRLPVLEPIPPRIEAPPGAVRFAFVGALLPTKGVDLALAAFGRLPAGAGTLDVYGPTPPWNGSTAWADALIRPPGSRFHGPTTPVPWADIDVLLFPSTWDENHPLVLTEAGAAGVRILAADVPGARWVAPQARFFAPGSTPGLHARMAAEVARGRGRVDPVAVPSLPDHARALLRRYAELG